MTPSWMATNMATCRAMLCCHGVPCPALPRQTGAYRRPQVGGCAGWEVSCALECTTKNRQSGSKDGAKHKSLCAKHKAGPE